MAYSYPTTQGIKRKYQERGPKYGIVGKTIGAISGSIFDPLRKLAAGAFVAGTGIYFLYKSHPLEFEKLNNQTIDTPYINYKNEIRKQYNYLKRLKVEDVIKHQLRTSVSKAIKNVDVVSGSQERAVRQSAIVEKISSVLNSRSIEIAKRKVRRQVKRLKREVRNRFNEIYNALAKSDRIYEASVFINIRNDVENLKLELSEAQSINKIISKLTEFSERIANTIESTDANIKMKDDINKVIKQLNERALKIKTDAINGLITSVANRESYLTLKHATKRRGSVMTKGGQSLMMRMIEETSKVRKELETYIKRKENGEFTVDVNKIEDVDKLIDDFLNLETTPTDVPPTEQRTTARATHPVQMEEIGDINFIRKSEPFLKTVAELNGSIGPQRGQRIKELNEVIDKVVGNHFGVMLSKELDVPDAKKFVNMVQLFGSYPLLGEGPFSSVYPKVDVRYVVSNIIKKYKEAFGLTDKDIKIGYDKTNIVIQFSGKAIANKLGIHNINGIQEKDLMDLKIEVPHFKGPLMIEHGRLKVGRLSFKIDGRNKVINVRHFGDVMADKITRKDFVETIKGMIREAGKVSAVDDAQMRNVLNNVFKTANGILERKIAQVTENATDITSLSYTEAVQHALKAIDPRSAAFSKRVRNMIEQNSIRDFVLLSMNKVKDANAQGNIIAQIQNAKRTWGNLYRGGQGAIERILARAETLSNIEGLNIISRDVTGSEIINRINYYDAQNTSFIANLFLSRAERGIEGELGLIDPTILFGVLQPEYAKSTKIFGTAMLNASKMDFGREYLGSLERGAALSSQYRMVSPLLYEMNAITGNAGAILNGYTVISFDGVSTEGTAHATKLLESFRVSDEHSTVKLGGTELKKGEIRKLKRILDTEESIPKEVRKAIKEFIFRGQNVRPRNETFDLTQAYKIKGEEAINLSRKIGRVLQENGLVPEKDEKVLDIIVRGIRTTDNGEVKIIYDTVDSIGYRNKIILSTYDKVLLSTVKGALGPKEIMSRLKKLGYRYTDEESAGKILLFYASKSIRDQRPAPLVQSIATTIIDKVVSEARKIRKGLPLQKDQVKKIVKGVWESILKISGKLPELEFKLGEGKNAFGGNEFLGIFSDKSLLDIRDILSSKGGKILGGITDISNVQFRNDIMNVVKDAIRSNGFGESDAKKVVNKILGEIFGYDKNGNLLSLTIKQDIVIANQNRYELAATSRISKDLNSMVTKGAKFGFAEYMALEQRGFTELATSYRAHLQLGKEYLQKYYIALAKMMGYTDEDLKNIIPGNPNMGYTRRAPTIITQDRLRALKRALERGEKDSDLYGWLQPSFKESTTKETLEAIRGLQKSETSEILNEFIEDVDASESIDEEIIRTTSNEATKEFVDDVVKDNILTYKEVRAWKKFLRKYNEIKLKNRLPLPITHGGERRWIDKLYLPDDVDIEKDFFKMKMKVRDANGALKYEDVYIPNRLHRHALTIVRNITKGKYQSEVDLGEDVVRYFSVLFNHTLKSTGSPIEVPQIRQIGTAHLAMSKNDAEVVLESLSKSKTVTGETLRVTNINKGTAMVEPGLGEVIVSKEMFEKMLRSKHMDPRRINKITREIIQGKRRFMANLFRTPTLGPNSLQPVYIRILDNDKVKKRINKDLSDAFIVNGIDALSVAGDFDRDFYSVVSLITLNKEREVADYLKNYFKDYGFKVKTVAGEEIITPTGERSKILWEQAKEAINIYVKSNKGEVTKEKMAQQLAKGVKVDEAFIREKVKELMPDAKAGKIKRVTEMVMKELKGINDLYLPSNEIYVKLDIETMINRAAVKFDSLLGLNTTGISEYAENLIRFNASAAGYNPSQINAIVESIKQHQAGYAIPYIGVKALTGEIYNIMHNKFQATLLNIARDKPNLKDIVNRLMRWSEAAQQINISSKKFFPAIAGDIVQTMREFALNRPGTKAYEEALNRIKTGNFRAFMSIQTARDISKTASDLKILNKYKEEDFRFLKELEERFTVGKNGKHKVYKSSLMSLKEIERYLKIRKHVYADNEEFVRTVEAAEKKIAELPSKLAIDRASDLNFLQKYHSRLAKSMQKNRYLDIILQQNFDTNVIFNDVSNVLDDIIYGSEEGPYGAETFRMALFPAAKNLRAVPEEIRNAFVGKTATKIVSDKATGTVSKLASKMLKQVEGKEGKGMTKNIKEMGRGGAGLLLGAAVVGFIAAQAAGSPADSWLGKSQGFGGEISDRKRLKSDEELRLRATVDAASHGLGIYGKLALPKAYTTKYGRIYIEKIPGRYPNIEAVMKGQFDSAFSPSYLSAVDRTVTPKDKVMVRIRSAAMR